MSAPIIITVPNNYLAVDEDTKVVLEPASPAPSRKRRLDHLSWEEKMQRKKLKNRVAAQTSRDRKKAKMDEMEFKIQELADRNERLISEVESLKALNERLLSENTELRAARSVSGARGPAAGGAPDGTARGAPAAGDVSPLADLLQHLESEEYLDTLQQLADSLLKEIDAGGTGAAEDVPVRDTGERPEGAQVVGAAAEHLEPSEAAVVDLKHDVHRILTQHSYAHPYTDAPDAPDAHNDKGDIFYASLQENCVTVEVPCEEQVIEETQVELDFPELTKNSPIQIETDFASLTDGSISLDDMKMLSPMSLSPRSDEDLLAVSPSHSFSDLGYDSMASPLSEPESMDLSDFWCESFSELFPGLA